MKSHRIVFYNFGCIHTPNSRSNIPNSCHSFLVLVLVLVLVFVFVLVLVFVLLVLMLLVLLMLDFFILVTLFVIFFIFTRTKSLIPRVIFTKPFRRQLVAINIGREMTIAATTLALNYFRLGGRQRWVCCNDMLSRCE